MNRKVLFWFALMVSLVGVAAKAEMVAEEVIVLDPSGMLSKKTVMVEKGIEGMEKTNRAKADAAGAKTDEGEPFLTALRVNRFAPSNECQEDNGRIFLKRIPVQGNGGTIVLEAEEGVLQPNDVGVSAGGALGFDARDACRYAVNLKRGEYAFKTDAEGTYHAWYRIWFPLKGHWTHAETMDTQPNQPVNDSFGAEPVKEWRWIKGPVYNLKAGPHRLTLDCQGGAKLDKIVLSLQGIEPKGKGPSACYDNPPTRGRFETLAIAPQDIRRWHGLNLNPMGGGGQAEAQCSLDDGKTWRPLPTNGDLQGIGIDGGKTIKLAFELRSSAEGITPMLLCPTLKYVYIPVQPLVLGNGKIELLFSRENGSLAGIRNLQSSQDCMVRRREQCPLIALTVLKDKELKELKEPLLTGQNVSEGKNGKLLTQAYQWLDGRVEAVVTVRLSDSEEAVFGVRVKNNGEAPIVHVDFPRLSGLRIGEDGKDDYAYISACCGCNNLFKNPGNTPLAHTQYSWQPSMKWMDLWDASGGLYVASHDSTFRDTAMQAQATPQSSLSFLFGKLLYLAPGKDWQSEPYIVAPHLGDWHWAAREYGNWARTCQKPPDNPKWLSEEFDGLVTGANNEVRFNGYMNVVRVVEENASKGGLVDMMSPWQGYDTMAAACTLYPYPRPDQGGAEEFSQMCEMVKQHGGHSIWYMNWLLMDPNYATLPRIGMMAKKLLPPDVFVPDRTWVERTVTRTPAGGYQPETPKADTNYCNTKFCDETAEWADYKLRWAERYVKNFNADGVYWDCLLQSYGDPCYDVSHHSQGDLGQWIRSSTETLRKMTEAARASNPHAFNFGEGTNQPGIMQYQNLSDSMNMEVFRYAFPECLCLGGQWDYSWLSPEGVLNMLNCAFLNGARARNWDVRTAGGKLPPGVEVDYGFKLLQLCRRVKQLLYPAVFRDEDGLVLELPPGCRQESELSSDQPGFFAANGILKSRIGIHVKRFTLARGSTKVELINTVNTDMRAGGFITLEGSSLAAVRKAWEFSVSGDLREVPIGRETVARIPIPVSQASSLVLVESCEPLLTILAPSYGTWGETIPVKVKVLNLNPQSISGRLWIKAEAGFEGNSVAYGPLAPGEERTYALKLVPGPQEPSLLDFFADKALPRGRHDLEVIAEGNGLRAERLFWIYLGDPLRLAIYPNAERQGVDVQMENFSSKTMEGTCALTNDAVFGTPDASYPFNVQPSGKTRVTLPLVLKSPLDIARLAQVVVKYGQHTTTLVKAVLPSVPNPDFEIDIASDGHPDYWIGRQLPGDATIGYNQWRLDRQEKHTGNASVCLNPPIGADSFKLQSSGAGRFGKTYRVRVAIKREAPSDKVYAQVDFLGGALCLGQKGGVGVWEGFEGVISTAKTNPDTFNFREICPITFILLNGSGGRAWFDSISVEEMKPVTSNEATHGGQLN